MFYAALLLSGLLVGSADAKDPYDKTSQSWSSISGTAVNPTADSFLLDYGDGVITVEVDDWDSWGDAYGRLDGDKVRVTGHIDHEFLDKRVFEADRAVILSSSVDKRN